MAVQNGIVIITVFFFQLIIASAKTTGHTASCDLHLQKDFGYPSPVLLHSNSFVSPHFATGNVTFKGGQFLIVSCPGDEKYLKLGELNTKTETARAFCITKNKFRIGQWAGNFSEVRCNAQPWFSVEPTKKTCHGSNTIYKAGYKVNNTFHALYEACFDQKTLTTLYVKHSLSPSNRFIQSGESRPQFKEGSMFGKHRMSNYYKSSYQKDRITAMVGENLVDHYLTKKQFLTRGHLAPRGDFSLNALQRASFHYVNVAPQWMRGNAGDWAALEDSLRRRIQAYNSTVILYTGTHGVMTLDNKAGHPVEYYLASDENNNAVLPVPLYFYKVVHDPHKKTAAVFVSINSSYYNKTTADKLTFCSDICEENDHYSWLRWRSDGHHSFCCSYSEFVDEVGVLPRLEVNGLFY